MTSGKSGPKTRVKYPLNGEMLSTSAISERTGMSVKTIYSRLRRGIPLDKPKHWANRAQERGPGPALYQHAGEMKTAKQWAKIFGVTPQCIRARAKLRKPLDGSYKPRSGATKPRYDNSMNGLPSVFDDRLRPEEDRAVAEIERYLSRATLMMTDEEIRAQFADLGRLSDEGVDWAREQAEVVIFHQMKRGDGESLELVGDLHGFCRERSRQLEERSVRKLRRVLTARGVVPSIIAELRDRDTRRRATWAEIMDERSIGGES